MQFIIACCQWLTVFIGFFFQVFSVICLGLYAADLIMTLLKVMGRTSTTTTTTTTTSSSTTYGGQDNIHAPQWWRPEYPKLRPGVPFINRD